MCFSFYIISSDPANNTVAYTKRGQIRLKKVVKQPHKWIRNVAKAKRNIGEEYIARGGYIRPARHLQQPCDQKCYQKCTVNFNDDQRMQIFKYYWNLGDLTLQRQYIINSMHRVQPKYRRPKEGSKRSLNYAYYMQADGGERLRVCKTFFLNTLDVSRMTVDTALRKYNEAEGCLEGELRGGKRRLSSYDESCAVKMEDANSKSN